MGRVATSYLQMGDAGPAGSRTAPPRLNAGNGTTAKLLAHAVAGPFLVSHKAYSGSFSQTWHEHPVASIDVVLAGGGLGHYRCGSSAAESITAGAGGAGFYRHEVSHRFASGRAGIRSMHLVIPPEVVVEAGVPRDLWTSDLGSTPALRGLLAILQELHEPDTSSSLSIESLAREVLGGLAIQTRRERFAPGFVRIACARLHDSVGPGRVEEVGLSELAALGNVHPGHLARTFKQRFGVSVGTYHRRLRVAEALRRLGRGTESIAWIAAATGFADQAHLTRTMRTELGVTPAAVRRSLARA